MDIARQLFDRELMSFEERLALAETLSHTRVPAPARTAPARDGRRRLAVRRAAIARSVTRDPSDRRRGLRPSGGLREGTSGLPRRASSMRSASTPSTRVIDLGCGTGKFTRLVRHARVLGVEPLATMLGGFRSALPDVPRRLAGRPKRSRCATRSADVVDVRVGVPLVRPRRALSRRSTACSRPADASAIIWNRRDKLEGWAAEFWDDHRAPPRRHARLPDGGLARRARVVAAVRPIDEHWFEHTQRVDRDGLLARIASISFIETLPGPTRAAVHRRVGTVPRLPPGHARAGRSSRSRTTPWCTSRACGRRHVDSPRCATPSKRSKPPCAS